MSQSSDIQTVSTDKQAVVTASDLALQIAEYELSLTTFEEISEILLSAGYGHCVKDKEIDMSSIAIKFNVEKNVFQISINGDPFNVGGGTHISYEQVRAFAFPEMQESDRYYFLPRCKWRNKHGDKGGALLPHKKVELSEGMIFTITSLSENV